MTSTMQHVPLGIRRLLEHAVTVYADQKLFTAQPGGDLTEATFAETGANAARLAHALVELGVGQGDRVATLMWNNQEHVEAYYAVPAMGAVLHPLNLRLPGEQIAFVANHAEDKVVIVDHTLLAPVSALLPALKTIEHVIVNSPAGADTDLAAVSAAAGREIGVHDYAQLIAGRPGEFDWPETDENAAAAMCYTSGTTGDPKGVVYSHRSIFLHSMAAVGPAMMGLSQSDRVLAIVPQFHVLAWGLPYIAFYSGVELVLPGPFLQPEPLARMIEKTRLNRASGVPTIWQGLLAHLEANPDIDVSSLKEAVVGGSACPPALMEAYDRLGITLLHAYGMTETSPMVTVARPPAGLTPEQAWPYRLTQGRFVANVAARLVGADGSVLPWDGVSAGELELRGPWIAGGYYGVDDEDKFHDGWLRTGDVGHISPEGYLTLTDRAKDVIKSGGEWISSVQLENLLMAHPAVAEASVIGVPDERWGERPLALVVPRSGAEVSFIELREFLADKIARWQVPERWAVISEVPKTSVGKFDKKRLREQYALGELEPELVSSH
ncbi:long-chain fatty acid--CoA ligase [Frankia sp. CNm7]|uniref:Long-chain fatty acid--CoA ligase n=1 Tax=Frankia nepalensis TaxID=1836974 RepID=A0A937RFX0_9ACTN|nr:long-chain fatty acid--CoA ligase [Frankia nepalensis]MBL7497726.1 long-chain fatty acid--CoA ligase [Frankia nepalensis]MBL7514164.1 long-chain fatty acid--CoA ligase [Frankia nepalensis]MBL7523740.1 long-chain fatty acid--CoA ligase [Frankia nepalensis]MBL7625643.1 long-chain fatty acid--CoA ligase [Frankia nepalensis]